MKGGPNVARIGVISASNANTPEGDRVIGNFARLGVKVISIPVNETRANDSLVVSALHAYSNSLCIDDETSKYIGQLSHGTDRHFHCGGFRRQTSKFLEQVYFIDSPS